VKLHDLKPAPGSRKDRIRVGRGISAGKGKTAGRGTKGQKSRAGGNLPSWFEGGQTPAHVRLPKLHGFKRRFRVEYQVVNVGRISEYAEAGRFGAEPGKDPLTINNEVLRAAGLISNDRFPVKVLGHGDVTLKLFVAAEAFTKTAREKIETAGGFVQSTAVVVVKGETKQDRADARAAIAKEKQKAADVADAARWAVAPAATHATAPAAPAAPSAPAAKAAAPAKGESRKAAAAAARTAEREATAAEREATAAEPEPPAAEPEAPAAEPAADEAPVEVQASVADEDTEPAAPDSSDEDSAAEDSDEAPAPRRRSRKSTNSSDE
jgi:large subunit ribosomal protein L15